MVPVAMSLNCILKRQMLNPLYICHSKNKEEDGDLIGWEKYDHKSNFPARKARPGSQKCKLV